MDMVYSFPSKCTEFLVSWIAKEGELLNRNLLRWRFWHRYRNYSRAGLRCRRFGGRYLDVHVWGGGNRNCDYARSRIVGRSVCGCG
jgi:hypothetical protein